jgi:hypothetical protein
MPPSLHGFLWSAAEAVAAVLARAVAVVLVV